MTGASGFVGDDSEPLELKKHAPLQLEDIDMRINVLKEYISKVPDATLKDLKKSLIGYSKYTDDEFKTILKSANLEKYNGIFPQESSIISDFGITKIKKPAKIVFLPKVNLISEDIITSGSPYKRDELLFLQTHSNLPPRRIWVIYKIAFPNSQRNSQFIGDCRHLTKNNPSKYLIKDIKPQTQSQIKHTALIETPINSHILAQAITALYKSGKSPKLFSQIKPVIELIEDPDEVAFAIECLTS